MAWHALCREVRRSQTPSPQERFWGPFKRLAAATRAPEPSRNSIISPSNWVITLSYVWESRFGAMLIEVIDGQSFVNGKLVELPDSDTDAKGQPPSLG